MKIDDLVKKFFATYQGITLDEPGSDCKSKGYREVKLTKKNIDQFKLRYMIEGSKLVMLTPENKEKYIGKTVKMRSPMYCVGDKLCNKCAGELYYKIGIRNIGLTTSSVGSNFLQYLMKSFHDSTLSLNEVDLNDFIVE